MENMQDAAGIQDNSIMKSVNQRVRSKGHSDIMTRRLKNRERQRRYRARKRLEAETRKPFVEEETIPVLEPQVHENHSNFMTRIYCKRNWKKDARRAHVPKHQEMNGSINPSPTLTSVAEVTCFALENKTEIQSGSSTVNNETPTVVLGRRDWKAEARRKKN